MATTPKPHPLVAAVAEGLKLPLPAEATAKIEAAEDGSDEQQALVVNSYAAAFASAEDGEVVCFAGYSGATVERNGKWLVFYLDPELMSWVLVNEDDVVLHKQIAYPSSPDQTVDLLWVKGGAPVAPGRGMLSVEAQFLTGEFTRAGDLDPGPNVGGTYTAATGPFLQGQSFVGCCYRKSGKG